MARPVEGRHRFGHSFFWRARVPFRRPQESSSRCSLARRSPVHRLVDVRTASGTFLDRLPRLVEWSSLLPGLMNRLLSRRSPTRTSAPVFVAQHDHDCHARYEVKRLVPRRRRSLPSLVAIVRRVLTGERKTMKTTLSGGSLGSCVDEERSQLRELM